MFKQIHKVKAHRRNGTNGHSNGNRIRRPIDWQDRAEIEAMVLFGFGFSWGHVIRETGVSRNRLQTLCTRAKIKPTDYRECRDFTVGARIANKMLATVKARYRGVVVRALPAPAVKKRGALSQSNMAASSR